jgi:hypothetical protein
MTEDQFRTMALDLPEAEEREHMDHPDFRVKGKIFATLGSPKPGWGMVKLTPEQQQEFMKIEPGTFVPAAGAWGVRGATHVLLKSVDRAKLRKALLAAWRNTAPKKMVEELGPEK